MIHKLQIWNSQRGFTLIELLVVFALMAVLSVVSFASFSSFNTSQKLTSTVLDIKNTLQQAKSQAFNQVDTCPSGQSFNGYQVKICCSSAACSTCSSLNPSTSNGYELDIVCSGTASPISGKTLPSGMTVNTNSGQTTTYNVLFNPLTNTVTGNGQIVLQQGSTSKSISVSATGLIQ